MSDFIFLEETPFFQSVIRNTANPRLTIIYEQLSHHLNSSWDKYDLIFEKIWLGGGWKGEEIFRVDKHNMAYYVGIDTKYRFYNSDADTILSIRGGVTFFSPPRKGLYQFNSGELYYGEGLGIDYGCESKKYYLTSQDLFDEVLIQNLTREVNQFLNTFYDRFLESFHNFAFTLVKEMEKGGIYTDCPKEVLNAYAAHIYLPPQTD